MKPPGWGTAPTAMQNPSKPVADPHQKTPERGAPGFVYPWPVFTVESDTLSGRARRGLDRALGVADGVRGGRGGPGRGGQGVGGLWAGGCLYVSRWGRRKPPCLAQHGGIPLGGDYCH